MITVNSQNISTTWGIEPARDGYYNGLMQFPDIKDRLTNDWTDQNGLQVQLGTGYLKHKEFTMNFLCDTYAHYESFLKYLVANPSVEWFDSFMSIIYHLEYLACSSFNKYVGYNMFTIKVRESNPTNRTVVVPEPPAPAIVPVVIGQSAFGGKVAYILQSGDFGYDPLVQKGIIAAVSDLPSKYKFGEGMPTFTTSDLIGYGRDNTMTLLTDPNTDAARQCDNLTSGGVSGWHLPSINELKKIYLNRSLIGGIDSSFSTIYWSSSDGGDYMAKYVDMETGVSSTYGKTGIYKVRPVRYFINN